MKDMLRIEGVNAKGFGILPKLVVLDQRLPLGAKALYAYFCSYSGSGTSSFPSRDRIIAELGISKGTYYRLLDRLKELGYLKVHQELNSQKFSRNIYTLVAKPASAAALPKVCLDEDIEILLQSEGVKARGYGAIPKLLMTDDRLSLKSKAIYAYFAAFAGAGYVAFPALLEILHHLGISENTYFNHLRQLKETGYLEIQQLRIAGRFARSIYTLSEFPAAITPDIAPDIVPDIVPETPCIKNWGTVESAENTVSQKLGYGKKCRVLKIAVRSKTPCTKNCGTVDLEPKTSCIKNWGAVKRYTSQRDTIINNLYKDRWMDKESVKSDLKDQVDLEGLLANHATDKERIEGLLELMTEVMVAGEDTPLWIAGQTMPAIQVKERFTQIDYWHIEYVLEAMNKTTKEIRNIKNYLLTALYNAPATLDHHIHVQLRRAGVI